jgi:hypothetical protein
MESPVRLDAGRFKTLPIQGDLKVACGVIGRKSVTVLTEDWMAGYCGGFKFSAGRLMLGFDAVPTNDFYEMPDGLYKMAWTDSSGLCNRRVFVNVKSHEEA